MTGGISLLERAKTRLFLAAGIDDAMLSRALAVLGSGQADLADLYFENVRSRSWRLDDGRVTAGSFRINQGVGARASRQGQVAFAHSAEIGASALSSLAGAVHALRRDEADRAVPIGPITPSPSHTVYPPIDLVAESDAAPWINLLQRVDAQARGADPRIVRVDAFVRAVDQTVLVADLDGGIAADIRPTVQLMIDVVAEAKGRRSRGRAGLGGRHGLAMMSGARLDGAIARSVDIALVNLDARPAPTGMMPVVLGPGYPGVLFHEAVGHGLEGDHHRKRLSAFDGRLGERVAAPGVTVIDDGTLPDKLGSLGIDDEGTPAERTVLIEDGMLTGLMQDRLNASLMNMRSTGNSRRQSYAHLPMPRMTNTFLASGKNDPADILASVDHGIYAAAIGGGQVDITSGRFNFSTTQAWLIEKGRLTAPIDGATLIGVGHEALKHVSMVGHDLALDDGVALCSKAGQSVDVGVGQPTIRIDHMMVGGSAN